MANNEKEILMEPEAYIGGGGGTKDFNELENRPKYNGQEMTGDTDIPEVKEYSAGNGLDLNGTEFSVDTDVVALKSDIPEVPEVVQTTGDSTASVMSQKAATDAISSAAGGVDTKIGDLADLTTTAKTTVVAAINEVKGDVGDEATARVNADNGLQGQIDALAASSDVTDIVGTKAELNAYDTSKLKDNDIIKVLQDESQNNETTYYRWSTSTGTFTLIGEEGPYYTKSAADQKFQEKLIAGSNISIASDGKTISATDTTYSDFSGATSSTAGTSGLVPAPASGETDKYLKSDGTWATVSQYSLPIASANDLGGIKVGNNLTINSTTGVLDATDTTYSNFTGTDGQTAGVAGLVPAPATTDAGKYLKADGTWDTVSAGHTYTAGDGIDISAQDVISATNTGKAKTLTTDDYNWNSSTGATGTPNCIALWLLPTGTYVGPANSMIAVRPLATTSKTMGNGFTSIAIVKHMDDTSSNRGGVILLDFSNPQDYCIYYYNISSSGSGSSKNLFTTINNTLTSTSTTSALSANQGKTLKDLIDSLVIKAAGAPTTATVGTVGMLYEDTTNGKLYQCTAVTPGTDPDPDTYTWTEVGGGSGPTVVQTTGTSTTDVMSQNAVTSMIYADPSTRQKIQLGNAIVTNTGSYGIAIGNSASTFGARGISIGVDATATAPGAIALGAGASVSTIGMMSIGSSNTSYGYNSSNYRLLTGLYDPQNAHDAATKGYVDGLVGNVASALNIINNGTGA